LEYDTQNYVPAAIDYANTAFPEYPQEVPWGRLQQVHCFKNALSQLCLTREALEKKAVLRRVQYVRVRVSIVRPSRGWVNCKAVVWKKVVLAGEGRRPSCRSIIDKYSQQISKSILWRPKPQPNYIGRTRTNRSQPSGAIFYSSDPAIVIYIAKGQKHPLIEHRLPNLETNELRSSFLVSYSRQLPRPWLYHSTDRPNEDYKRNGTWLHNVVCQVVAVSDHLVSYF
jgi:hypothetical protein